jgi:hypothetical protein
MSDREMLELAAKAAGYVIRDSTRWKNTVVCQVTLDDGSTNYVRWNPLADDGDALRLAVTCGLVVDCSRPSAGEPYKQHAIWLDETMSNAELTRRAIVRAAAEIGRRMT